MKVQKYAFFGKLNEKWQKIKEVPLAMCLSMLILAFICILGGLLITPQFKGFLQSAVDVLLNGKNYANLVFQAVK